MLLPNRQTKTRTMATVALLAALLAITAPFVIPLGPVPLTLAMLWVFFIGLVLPPLPAVAAVVVYLLLGLTGLPVFSGFCGGPGVLLGPTGGYLVGYVAAALLPACAARHTRRPGLLFASMMGGLLACYLLGTVWFMWMMGSGLRESLAACVWPFVLPDAAKAGAALFLARRLERRLGMPQ